MPETWDELARKEYADPDEPISARASDLTKIGAPVAAFITAVLAAVGGWVADAPSGHTVIAVAIVVAVAVAGLLYVLAADFRSRAAVSVARFNNLCAHAKGEAKANEKVDADARAAVEKAEVVSATKSEEAVKAKKQAAEVTAELVDTRERLRRCNEQSKPGISEDSASPAFLTLDGVDAIARGAPTKVYGVETAGGQIIGYLVRGPEGRLDWLPEADVSGVGGPPNAT
jgi:transposase